MATYTATEANNIIDNGFTVTEGEGWICLEEWSAGYNETDRDGNTVLNFKGWHYQIIDGAGYPVEFLLESTAEGTDEATRRADAKTRIQTIEKAY